MKKKNEHKHNLTDLIFFLRRLKSRIETKHARVNWRHLLALLLVTTTSSTTTASTVIAIVVVVVVAVIIAARRFLWFNRGVEHQVTSTAKLVDELPRRQRAAEMCKRILFRFFVALFV